MGFRDLLGFSRVGFLCLPVTATDSGKAWSFTC